MKVKMLSNHTFYTFENVIKLVLPTRNKPVYIITTKEEETSIPAMHVEYCKKLLDNQGGAN